jgi:hypothetical protein
VVLPALQKNADTEALKVNQKTEASLVDIIAAITVRTHIGWMVANRFSKDWSPDSGTTSW